ncbi:Uncharacterised protein [Candidatus Burarchaeum australiense]|nr:Uncharacterised protein [Candidatus Burarchaeum australiense]
MSLRAVAGKEKILVLVLFAVLALSGCAGVTKTGPGGTTELVGYEELLDAGHWQPIAVMAIFLSFFVVAIAYMLAEGLRIPELNAWAKNELFEVLISVFLLVSVFFLVALSENLSQHFTGGLNHIEWGKAYLENLKVILELNMYPLLIFVDMVVSTLATWNFSYVAEISAVALVVGTSPESGLNMIAGSLIFMIDSVGMFIAVSVAQMQFLDFAEKFALGLFLPLGIVLRTFSLTRKLGSTLIALAITMYFVYPLTLALNQEIFDAAYTPITNWWYDQSLAFPNTLDPSAILMTGQIMTYNNQVDLESDKYVEGYTAKETAITKFWQWLANLKELHNVAKDPQNYMGNSKVDSTKFVIPEILLPGIGFIKMFHSLIFKIYGPWMMQTAVLVVVLPVIDIIISITFFRSFSMAIGGEPEIMGLTRIV